MKNAMSYTSVVQDALDAISFEDDAFVEKLLSVAQLFRPFSEAIEEFLQTQGFTGDIQDVAAKVAFIRSAFENADMTPPREIREWFTAGQPVKRDTIFQLCFAFGLDGNGTDEFFRRIYTRERSFDCHNLREAIYYFCMNNGLSYADALDIQNRVPLVGNRHSGEVVYTGSIIADLNGLETKEELIAYLSENIDTFTDNNVTACETIRRLWALSAGPDGLLMQECQRLSSILDDQASGRHSRIRSAEKGIRPWDAYLAILQLDKKEVKRLDTDRSIKPILKNLHGAAQDSFPDRQGIDRILRGEPVSYERMRKWLVLLTFYVFWARNAIKTGDYAAKSEDANRCIASMNQYLMDAGYPELYVGNPYDWIFLFAAKSEEPLFVFRFIWNELLTDALE